jgi:hypothetical protein
MKEDDEKVLKYKSINVTVQCIWKIKPTAVTTANVAANGS